MPAAAAMKPTLTTASNTDLPSASMVAVAKKQRLQDAIFHRLTQSFSLLVLVALSNQSGRSAQRAFEACMKACPQVLECQLISGHFDYSLRMRCRDMEHYRVLTETWLNNDELHIDKLVAHPELAVVKNTATELA